VIGLNDLDSSETDDLVTEYEYTSTLMSSDLPKGMIRTIIDPRGYTTTLEYDDTSLGTNKRFGLLTSVTEAVGEAEERATLYTYDNNRNIDTVTDGNGNVTDYDYDELNQLIQITLPDADGVGSKYTAAAVWVFAYAGGKLQSATDPRSKTTTYGYDNRGRLHTITGPSPDGIEDEPVWTYTYDAVGNLKSVEDPLENVTEYDYDANGNLIEIKQPKPDSGDLESDRPVWTFAYDALNLLISEIDPRLQETNYDYDERLNLASVTRPSADGSFGNRPTTQYFYDLGNRLEQEIDPMGRITIYGYDEVNRLTSVELPDPDGFWGEQDASIWEYGYDKNSNLTSITQPLGQETTRAFDPLNRLIQIVEPIPVSGASHPTTVFTYDDADNLKTLTDPEGNTTEWFYDALNRVDHEDVDWSASDRVYLYDLNDNLIRFTDRNGRATTYDYDFLNRMTDDKWRDGSDAVIRTLHYEYDLADRLIGTDDPSAEYTFGYDDINRLTSVTTDISALAGPVVLESLYDKAGNRTQLAATIDSTADFVNDYVYDYLNRMTRVSQSGSSVTDKRVDFAYNLAGQFTAIDRFSDLTGTTLVAGSQFEYDDAGRLTRIQHDRGGSWVAHAYTYDENYRVTSYQNLIPSGNWDDPVTYTYDDTNQLLSDETWNAGGTGWNSPTSNQYEYDLAGNRTEKDGTAQTIDDGNRVTDDGTYTYDYDEEGNLVKRTDADGNERILEYDYRNRLVSVKDYIGTASSGTLRQEVRYEYDTFNRRVARWVDTNGDGTSNLEEFYVYDGDDVVLDFVDANGAAGGLSPTLKTRYLHGPAVDQILAQEDESTGGVLWMLTDQLGSVRDIVNHSGEGISHISYDAFGNVVGGTGVLLTRYLWTGREFDSVTGLQYNRNRWYDPTLGRWLSEDPIGFDGGDYTLTRYVSNDPVSSLDPFGLIEWNKRKPLPGGGFSVPTDSGKSNITVFKDDKYQCHSLTFGGDKAPGGPYMIAGDDVPAILSGDGFTRIPAGLAKPGDAVIWRDVDVLGKGTRGDVLHSGVILEPAFNPDGSLNQDKTQIRHKPGAFDPPGNVSVNGAQNQYGGGYEVYRPAGNPKPKVRPLPRSQNEWPNKACHSNYKDAPDIYRGQL